MIESQISAERPWKQERLCVPQSDETILAEPSLGEAVAWIGRNQADLATSTVNVQGRTLPHLRQWSRSEIVRAAQNYTAELLGDDPPGPAPKTVIVGGHQPTLFHPGVWIKNFALNWLAEQTGGVGINLVVDNDLAVTTSIRVPAGDRYQPRIEFVPYDEEPTGWPWEEGAIRNRAVFESFGQRVGTRIAAWGISPLLDQMWPDAVELSRRSDSLRDCLTAARNRLERRWGAQNLELPISRLCETDPFLWFMSHLLAHLPRFHEIHNRVLREYRQAHRIRSRTHPVPALAERDGWLEAPFWTWRKGGRQRRQVFVKQSGRELWLSDGTDLTAKLPLTPEQDACCAVKVLRELPGQGIRLRTRALTTTLFARLCLADLFVHGIGGARYDEMTDRIISRFFGLPAPAFLTLSATLNLPLGKPYPVTGDDLRRLRLLVRDLAYNADRHLDPDLDPALARLVAEKQHLVAQQQAARAAGLPRRERRRRSPTNRERFIGLKQINRALADCAEAEVQRALTEERLVQQRLDANGILLNREFAFCLYPAETLKSVMTTLLQPTGPQ